MNRRIPRASRAILTTLKLNGRSQIWERPDSTRLDLTSFNKLKVLEVPYFLLFDSPRASPARDGVHSHSSANFTASTGISRTLNIKYVAIYR
jgi:hypothetical protein